MRLEAPLVVAQCLADRGRFRRSFCRAGIALRYDLSAGIFFNSLKIISGYENFVSSQCKES